MRTAHLAPLLLVPVLLTACGGGDDAPKAGPTPSVGELAATASPARAQYARDADALCQKAVDASRLLKAPTTAAEYVASFKTALAIGQAGRNALRTLTPPPEDLTALEDAFLDPLDQQVANFEASLPRVEAAAKTADAQAELAKIPDPGASVTINLDYIRAYGMPACAAFASKG